MLPRRRPKREPSRLAPGPTLLAWTLVLAAGACATPRGVERRADGTLRTECMGTALAACLKRFGQVDPQCGRWGYDVVYGIERRLQRGDQEFPSEEVKSEAIVRCRQPVPLVGGDPNVPNPAPDVVRPVPEPRSRTSAATTSSAPPETDAAPPPVAAPIP